MPTAETISKMFANKAFICPHCNAYAKQTWGHIEFKGHENSTFYYYQAPHYFGSMCDHCGKIAIWLDYEILAYPAKINIPFPAPDMPDEIRDDYMEARGIAEKSPRSAAALLRLAIQKLMPSLGQKGKNLNDDIAALVKEGLPLRLQQALDYVRVIGNNAVHPGEIDLKDDIETAKALFKLLNMIIDAMITQPKRVDELYQTLPQRDLSNIEKRDSR